MLLTGRRARLSWLAAGSLGFAVAWDGNRRMMHQHWEPWSVAILVAFCALWWGVGLMRLTLERPNGGPPPKPEPAKGRLF